MEYTEIRIHVAGSAVESVANLVHEAGAGGVVIEQGSSGQSILTAWAPIGPPAEDLLARLRTLLDELAYLGLAGHYQLDTSSISEEDWAEEWKKYYHPVDLGSIVIRPSWTQYELKSGQQEVVLDPGMAFGTGIHPTTQGCISELLTLVTPGAEVLDIGCGSGILSIVAALLGAGKVEGIDSDPVAVAVAQENAQRNRCSQVDFRQEDGFKIFAQANYALVVANIGYRAAETLLEMFIDSEKQGILILSGFPEEHLEFLSNQARAGQVYLRGHQRQGWGILVVKR